MILAYLIHLLTQMFRSTKRIKNCKNVEAGCEWKYGARLGASLSLCSTYRFMVLWTELQLRFGSVWSFRFQCCSLSFVLLSSLCGTGVWLWDISIRLYNLWLYQKTMTTKHIRTRKRYAKYSSSSATKTPSPASSWLHLSLTFPHWTGVV